MAAANNNNNERCFGVTNIKHHIPVILDLNDHNYDAWRELILTHYMAFDVYGHLDGTLLPVGVNDKPWKKHDGLVKLWLYGTMTSRGRILLYLMLQYCAGREDHITYDYTAEEIEKIVRDVIWHIHRQEPKKLNTYSTSFLCEDVGSCEGTHPKDIRFKECVFYYLETKICKIS